MLGGSSAWKCTAAQLESFHFTIHNVTTMSMSESQCLSGPRPVGLHDIVRRGYNTSYNLITYNYLTYL